MTRLALLLLAALALTLSGCGSGSTEGSGGTATQPGEESGAERGNLLLDAEAAAFTLCIELGIDPCANEAQSVQTTEEFVAKAKEIAADNGIAEESVDATLRDAAKEIGSRCAECTRLLEQGASAP
jgi:hypothetical protein